VSAAAKAGRRIAATSARHVQALTCAAAGAQCGKLEDRCGGEIDCGKCGKKHECEDNRCVKED